jgi:hypothetical protein
MLLLLYLQGESPWYPLKGKVGGPQNYFERVAKKKKKVIQTVYRIELRSQNDP